jgi:hypothetical protein
MFFDQLGDIHCFQLNGVELREMRLIGWKPAEPPSAPYRYLLYKGPLAQVTDEDGVVYRRGDKVAVPAARWQLLRQGPAAGQFVFLPEEVG